MCFTFLPFSISTVFFALVSLAGVNYLTRWQSLLHFNYTWIDDTACHPHKGSCFLSFISAIAHTVVHLFISTWLVLNNIRGNVQFFSIAIAVYNLKWILLFVCFLAYWNEIKRIKTSSYYPGSQRGFNGHLKLSKTGVIFHKLGSL